MTISPLNYVTFTSESGLSVRVLLNSQSANITAGFGGWEIVQRPKRVSLTRFSGKDPFTMDVPVLFDGWKDGQSQEHGISLLMRMAVPPTDLQPPPTIRVQGAVPRKDLTWVIQDISFDNQSTYWANQSGVPVRLRQAAVVHLLQYVDDTVITTQPTPAVAASTGRAKAKVVTGCHETPQQAAQKHYGSSDLWTYIIGANPWMSPDPRQEIPCGKSYVVPSVPGITPSPATNPPANHTFITAIKNPS